MGLVQTKRSARFFLIVGLIVYGGWEVVDALGPKGVPFVDLLYSGSFFILSGLILIGILFLQSVRLRRLEAGIFFLFSFLVIYGIIQVEVLNWPRSERHVISDIATVLFLGTTLIFASLSRETLLNSNLFFVFLGLLLAASILAPIASTTNILPDYFWNDRFDPPHYALLSFCFAYLVAKTGGKKAPAFIFVLLIALLLYSGNRSNFISIAIMLLIWCLFIRPMVFIATLPVLLLGFLTFNPDISAYTSNFRIFQNTSVLQDSSLLARISEITDSFKYILENSSVLGLVFGQGPGAAWFILDTSPIGRDVESGYVHYLHFTPSFLFLRYGFLGLGAIVMLYVTILFDVFRVMRRIELVLYQPFFFGLFLSAVSFVIYSFFRFPLYDPPSLLVVSIYILVRRSYLKNSMDRIAQDVISERSLVFYSR